jgi:TRAP-type uncharacterized transport system fused permease subunit
MKSLYNPALLMLGDPLAVVWAVLTAVVGIVMLAGAVQGFAFYWHLRWYERVALLAAALTIIKPGLATDAAGAALAGLAALSVFLGARRGPAAALRHQPDITGDE